MSRFLQQYGRKIHQIRQHSKEENMLHFYNIL
jgi:predicted transposase YbfD/YdcC